MDAATSRAERSVNPARVCLWLAAGLLVASQIFVATDGQSNSLWIFQDLWVLLDVIVDRMRAGSFRIEVLLSLTVVVLSIIVPVFAPWVIGTLGRVRPWLWILRILMTGAVLWILWGLLDRLAYSGIHDEPLPFRAGYWLFLAAVLMNVVGLWMIPRAVKQPSYETAEIPTTDEHG